MQMTMYPFLTPGAVPALHNGSSISDPCLQIIDIKQIQNQGSYRVVLSDGQYYMAGVLASQLMQMVHDGSIQRLDIIKLVRYQPQEINGRRLIFIYDFVKQPPVNDVIGAPQKYGDAAAASVPNAAPTPAPATNYGAGSNYPTPAAPSYASNQGSYNSGAAGASSMSGGYGTGAPSSYGGHAAAGRPAGSYGAATNANPYGAAPTATSYGGADQKSFSPQQQQYQNYGSRGGPVVPTRAGRANIVNVADLNPYMTNWTIKARVTTKGEMKTWSNAKGEGNLFSFEVLDAGGGEIRLTAFKQDADRLFDLIQVGKVYLITGGTLKVANRNFTHLKHEYEITLGRETQVEAVHGDDNSISQMHFDFVRICQIENIAPNAFVDIIGIVTEVSPLGTITSKATQKDIERRNITIIDDSNKSIEITIWGKNAITYDENCLGANAVVAFKGLRVSEYSGRSLSTVNSSSIVVQPDIPQGHLLQQWFNTTGGAVNIDSLSKRGGSGSMAGLPFKTCSEIALDGNVQDQMFFLISATINVLQFNNDRPPWYLACPGPDCKKKVTDNGAGGYTCEKCNRTYPTCVPRYIFSFAVSDSTGSAWLSAFNETGEHLLGNRTADDIRSCVENGDYSAAESVFRDANFTEHIFKVKARFDNFNDSSRLRCTVMDAMPIDHAAECRRLCDLIRQY